jgi:AraC family transcriptional regulator, regulatory protein of adaptative response / methylated-DNA-[protein]-cysteine methyltransferase
MQSVSAPEYQQITDAIRFLAEHWREQPSLDVVADAVGLSPWHLQRVFTQWAGVSPKAFVQVLTTAHARSRLEQTASVFDAALDSGLSSGSRLHDLFLKVQGCTPGEFRSGGAGVEIAWGWAPSAFGDCFVASTPRGICFLAFDDGDRSRPLAELTVDWPNAVLRHDDAAARRWIGAAFGGDLPAMHLRGTPFQLQVWRALIAIPEGGVTSYGKLAAAIGRPSAARAVASAVARNPVSYLVPCHRVIRESGEFWKYRWGVDRKRAMLAYEAVAAQATGHRP